MEPLNYEPVKSTCICLFGAILRVASSSSWYVYTTERENTVLKNPQVCSFLHLLGPLWLKLVEATALMLGSLRVQTVWWSQSGGRWRTAEGGILQAAPLAFRSMPSAPGCSSPSTLTPCPDSRACVLICQRASRGPHWRALGQPGDPGPGEGHQ